MAEAITKTVDKQDTELLKPRKYKVIVLNDDKTPMDFVIAMFMTVFKHSAGLAEQLTMKIHNEGSAVAGIFTYEIAEQKTIEGTNMARDHNFPLTLKAEPE